MYRPAILRQFVPHGNRQKKRMPSHFAVDFYVKFVLASYSLNVVRFVTLSFSVDFIFILSSELTISKIGIRFVSFFFTVQEDEVRQWHCRTVEYR